MGFCTSGTTSACAENTTPRLHACMARGNYLRMRGEYPEQDSIPAHWWELPPHARRIHDAYTQAEVAERTTSACAENTVDGAHLLAFDWNYLRMRGEYPALRRPRKIILELPPHARRIPIRFEEPGRSMGTTSACAENTAIGDTYGTSIWELPPHARRIPDKITDEGLGTGTTSACAENTSSYIHPS